MENYIKDIEEKYNKEFVPIGTIVEAYGLKLEVLEISEPSKIELKDSSIRRYPYVCKRLDIPAPNVFTYSFYKECKIAGKQLENKFILGNDQDIKINK